MITYLLTYLAITTYYRSWPQLICCAIHHALLQLGAKFGYPALLHSHPPVWPNAGEVYLRLISRLMSLSVFMLEPRYTKSFTTSILQPSISTDTSMVVSLAVVKRNFVLLSFTARPILRAYLEKAASTSQILLPMMSTLSAYARGMILL